MKPLAKPSTPPIAYGARVRITFSDKGLTGRTGVAGRCFIGRPATPDTVMIQLDEAVIGEDGRPVFLVSVPLRDVEVVS